MGVLLKFLGLIDILSALMIIFNVYSIHPAITYIHGFVLITKGAISLPDIPFGIVSGIADIIAALFIIFAVTGLGAVKFIIVAVLFVKGFWSLL